MFIVNGLLGPTNTPLASGYVIQVHVLTTHLSLSHEAREQSVIQMWEIARELPGPVVVTGDFNAEPSEDAML